MPGDSRPKDYRDSGAGWQPVPDDPTLEVTREGALRSWRPRGQHVRSSRGEWLRLAPKARLCVPPKIVTLYTQRGERQISFAQALFETFVGPVPAGQRVVLRGGATRARVEDLELVPDLRRQSREAQVERAVHLIKTDGFRATQKTSELPRDVLVEGLFLAGMEVLKEIRNIDGTAKRLKVPVATFWLVLNRREEGRLLVWDVVEGEKARKALARKRAKEGLDSPPVAPEADQDLARQGEAQEGRRKPRRPPGARDKGRKPATPKKRTQPAPKKEPKPRPERPPSEKKDPLAVRRRRVQRGGWIQ